MIDEEAPYIFDTHTHYDDPRYDEDRDELLDSLASFEVRRVVDVCAELGDLEKVLSLAGSREWIYAAAGVHPSNVGELDEDGLLRVRQAAREDKVVAIGEIGLDYHYRMEDDPSEADPPREVQRHWFRRQLELAVEVGLPVIIHSRDAAAETLDIMRDAHSMGVRGVIHCFSGSPEMAREYVSMGYYIGVGGVVTFKNGRTLQQVVRETPLSNIVIETDCPYLSPEPHRGERNDSRFLTHVVDRIAELKDADRRTVMGATWKNACDLYGLPVLY